MLELKNIKCEYTTDQEIISRFSRNYGRRLHLPSALFTPRTHSELQQVIALAYESNVPLALKGFGHCAGRQQEAKNGFLVDIRSMNQVHGIQEASGHPKVIIADAGASWKEVVNFSLKNRLMPPVYTDWLMLTLGGTLSYGGVGSASFKHGLQTDHIMQADLITGSGKWVTLSADQNQDLFHHAKASLGQLGVFTQFHLRLVAAPEKVSLYKVVYTDPQAFMLDSKYWAQSKDWDGILGHFECNRREIIEKRIGKAHLPDSRLDSLIQSSHEWLGILEFTQYHSSHQRLDGESLLKKMKNWELVFHEEYSLSDYLNRVPPILDSDLEHENSEHEECTLFLPSSSETETLVSQFLRETHSEQMGYGTILFVPMKSAPITTPLFRKPQSEDFFLLGLLRRVLPRSPVSREDMVRMNLEFYRKATHLGGLRYPCDSVTGTNWAQHYGEQWSSFLEMKKKFDPKNILSPGVGIF